MKRIFTLLFACICVLGLKAQDVMLCNFDDVLPSVSVWGTMTYTTASAPAGTLASGKMGVLTAAADNEGGSFIIQMDNTFDPHTYAGISLVAQMPQTGLTPAFVFKLNQSSDPGHANILQDWNKKVRYSGSGDWEVINLPFDSIIATLDAKLDADYSFPADQYDQIELAPGAWDSQPAFTMNVDNIMLRTKFDGAGIPVTKVAAFVLSCENGIVRVVGGNGNPVSLKVYSIAGQEIVQGINEVQVAAKGVYIVKATSGNVTSVNKIIVQ
jgi:hypothetical protein